MPDQQKYLNKLNGDHVLIIGGSSGIGHAIAEACLKHGCIVTISASSALSAKNAHKRLKESYPSAANRITSLACNLGSTSDIEANIAKLFQHVSKSGLLDHIIFTAGDQLAQMPIHDVTLSRIQHAGFGESSITLTSGVGSYKMGPEGAVAGAYAAGLHGMARALAVDLQPVRVNVVAPGPTDTPLWRMPEQQKTALIEMLRTKLATGEIGSTENVAETYLGVLKDWNCTGAVLNTNGGYLLL
ncbi:hypothetical protein PFICI_06071 [Pestalotiopsis fici W106-1]|uniref:Uncharacterized protein n=1 Tax=Pestalotiopsis fici (strain W106-1 / CGMCC3.15140) TaxID=1229662 RepID=W3X4Y1_PESFW|nr:uncharacterized protein PFICI_06071 [Pestalotiopsis fici W106-1]ETS81069.1 hypothetical protein PFICI_06071 [Pestalotiopsis fici W106-1]